MAIIDFGGTKKRSSHGKNFRWRKPARYSKMRPLPSLATAYRARTSINLKDNGFNVIIGQSKQFIEDWNRR